MTQHLFRDISLPRPQSSLKHRLIFERIVADFVVADQSTECKGIIVDGVEQTA
jgi:hypothetical protein